MNNIEKYRGLKGMSQSELATKVQLTRGGLWFIESGKAKNVRSDKIVKIGEVLEVSPVMLMGMENFKFEPKTKEDIDYVKPYVDTLTFDTVDLSVVKENF